ncbi:hypothetical protein [Desertibacillus haloalkaliphilus]|uniref:hypothetical protein n=1 Tax=Desertibacillus haloalkaliphilus TaxID=1328930 RepID=UPI001C27A31A|nr:hypothetical protein [Desertibacillus haloalkaliphilus]MBU8907312.1 hypothetical protein [Desertibacillus haloalkaliphilus]
MRNKISKKESYAWEQFAKRAAIPVTDEQARMNDEGSMFPVHFYNRYCQQG